MRHLPLGFDTERGGVAVRSPHEPHAPHEPYPLDAVEGQRRDAARPTRRTRRTHPMPPPSVKVRCRSSGSSFQPVTLYSTERLSCWKRGEPFVPGIFARQLV